MILKLKIDRHFNKKKYRKYLEILPFIFTFLNAFFGFRSIIYSLEDNYYAAACCILIAAVMDTVDGELARSLNADSKLGMELDSLCDAISFCLAPIILLYSWYPEVVNNGEIVILGFYLCAGLLRLARFNLTSMDQKDYFIGLPTTVAAFFIANLVLYNKWMYSQPVLFILVFCMALLMISTVRFPTFKNNGISKKAKYIRFCIGFSMLFLSIKEYPLLLLCVSSYILAGIVFSIGEQLYKYFLNIPYTRKF